jgi:uncharacterized protein (TIGR03083 family)
MAEQQRAVAALAAEVNAITAAVTGAAEQDFARPTRCRGWAVKDLLLHLLRDAYWALVVFATPTQAPADVDFVSYWRTFDPADTAQHEANQRATRLAASGLVAPAAALRVAAAAQPGTRVATQGHVLEVDDFIVTLVAEVTIHGLDMAPGLGRAGWASKEGLALTHATVVGLLGREVPAELGWDKVRLVLKLTGRATLTDGERAMLGTVQDRLPVLG